MRLYSPAPLGMIAALVAFALASWLLTELLGLIFTPDQSLGIAPGAGLLILLGVPAYTIAVVCLNDRKRTVCTVSSRQDDSPPSRAPAPSRASGLSVPTTQGSLPQTGDTKAGNLERP
jgi:hypothetical protein